MSYGNKRVLVTGASGLIGRETIEPLKKAGFEIYTISRNKSVDTDSCVHCLEGNLFEESFVKLVMEQVKPAYLLNLAWCTTNNYLTSEKNYDFLRAGINLIKHFKNNGGKRAVYIGTCFEYKFKEEPLKETDELDTEKTEYTFCKDKLHQIAEYYCKRNSISFGYGRIFYVFGKNEAKTRLTAMIIENLINNKDVVIKSGGLQKDYMYSKDIAGALVKFLDSAVEGAVNIATGNSIYIRDYALTIANLLNKKELIKFVDESSNQPKIIVGDNHRLTQEVGYKIKYNLNDALKEVVLGYTSLKTL